MFGDGSVVVGDVVVVCCGGGGGSGGAGVGKKMPGAPLAAEKDVAARKAIWGGSNVAHVESGR